MIRRPPRSPLFPSTTLFRSLPSFAARPPYPGGQPLPVNGHTGWYTLVVDGLDPVARTVRHEQDRVPIDEFAKDRKSTRLNSSHLVISYAVFCFKKKKVIQHD